MIEGISSEESLPSEIEGHIKVPPDAKLALTVVPTMNKLIQISKVKAVVKQHGLRTGKDFLCALNHAVEQHIRCACDKVSADGKRVTLGAEDL